MGNARSDRKSEAKDDGPRNGPDGEAGKNAEVADQTGRVLRMFAYKR